MSRPRVYLTPALLTLGCVVILWLLICTTEPEISDFGSRNLTAAEIQRAATLRPAMRFLIGPANLIISIIPGVSYASDYLLFGLVSLFWGFVPYSAVCAIIRRIRSRDTNKVA